MMKRERVGVTTDDTDITDGETSRLVLTVFGLSDPIRAISVISGRFFRTTATAFCAVVLALSAFPAMASEPTEDWDIAQAPSAQPAAERPADFDEFWNGQLAELAKVPLDPQVETPDAQPVAGVKYAKFSLAVNDTQRVRGQLAWPDKNGKFPALIIYQWAGVYPLPPGTVTGNAQKGWLAVNVMAHDLPLDEPGPFYEALKNGDLKEYGLMGRDNRETSYFLRMYLGARRVVDFVRSLPEWDGKTLVVNGTSQGGSQALVAAALADGITAVVVNVPALCDQNAPAAGRGAPYPYWTAKPPGNLDPEKIAAAANYYDVVHFAPRVKAPALVSAGLRDQSCPPHGIAAMANVLGGVKELVFLPGANHQGDNGTHEPYIKRSKLWLDALREGKPVPPPQP